MSYLAPSAAEIRRHRWIVGGLSALMTVIVMTAFLLESRWGYLPPDPELIYMQSWRADRSRADAVAATQQAVAAREAKLAEARTYIGTLKGEARTGAQKQYDAYVAGGGPRKDIPYVTPDAVPDAAALTAAEPPVD